MKFKGNIEKLKDVYLVGGVFGSWEKSGTKYVFRCENDGLMNFFSTTGTINFQGPEKAKRELKEMFVQALKDFKAKKQTNTSIEAATQPSPKLVEKRQEVFAKDIIEKEDQSNSDYVPWRN